MAKVSPVDTKRVVTFLEAGVLMAAARGPEHSAERALYILQDPRRTFVSSVFLELETLPKALYHQRQVEAEFYRSYFQTSRQVPVDSSLTVPAHHFAATYGLNALDALHIAAAHVFEADEFITTEKVTKPLYRVAEVQVRYLADRVFA